MDSQLFAASPGEQASTAQPTAKTSYRQLKGQTPPLFSAAVKASPPEALSTPQLPALLSTPSPHGSPFLTHPVHSDNAHRVSSQIQKGPLKLVFKQAYLPEWNSTPNIQNNIISSPWHRQLKEIRPVEEFRDLLVPLISFTASTPDTSLLSTNSTFLGAEHQHLPQNKMQALNALAPSHWPFPLPGIPELFSCQTPPHPSRLNSNIIFSVTFLSVP